MSVSARAYLSPTLVFLAIDWPEGRQFDDFLGFAIRRTPGFRDPVTRAQNASDWLPNRLTFDGAVQDGKPDVPSNIAPIQKFLWWDARFGPEPGGKVTYEVFPVRGTAQVPVVQDALGVSLDVTLPDHVVDGVGTFFNRAVLSSQAFVRKLKGMGAASAAALTPAQVLDLRTWLANGMETVIPTFLQHNARAAAVVYHLTDKLWAIPAFAAFAQRAGTQGAIVYDAKDDSDDPAHPGTNQPARKELEPLGLTFYPRDKTAIMHDKFVVGSVNAGSAQHLLAGSANFTTEGLTSQANVLHTWDCPELAQRYEARAQLLADNPAIATTADTNDFWSQFFKVGGSAYVRSIFSPEPKDSRVQIDTIVAAIKAAKRSVFFCLFDPTDAPLRDACFEAGDRGLTMFGLCNSVQAPKPKANGAAPNAADVAKIELYHREQTNKDVVGAGRFAGASTPMGFEPERALFPGAKMDPRVPNVIIHHKFIVIDVETADPVVFSGSANMSNNSLHNNDENLLEIRSQAVSQIYLAEFMRLYEHYRARALLSTPAGQGALALAKDASWAAKYFKSSSPEAKSRQSLAQPAPPWAPRLG
jgi:hypothetical protein